MFVVETIARIRRAHFVQGKSIKAICRELRISRKTVRKVIRSKATDFHYERDEQPMPRLGVWREALDKLLSSNEAKSSRERLTLIRVFETLRGLGYAGGYDTVRRYARVMGPQPCGDIGGCIRAAELCTWRGVLVRLEPRGRADKRHDGLSEDSAPAAVP